MENPSARSENIRTINSTYTSEVFPQEIGQVLKDFGDQKIIYAEIHRRPIPGAAATIGNLATLGKLNAQKSKMNYDSFYHVWMNLKTEKGVWISTDKQHYLTAKASHNSPPLGVGVDSRVINVGGKTFRQMVTGAIDEVGSADNLAKYHPTKANCQLYLKSLLGNSLSQEDTKWLVQDVGDALSERLGRYTTGIVNIASKVGPDRFLKKQQRDRDLLLNFNKGNLKTTPQYRDMYYKENLDNAKYVGNEIFKRVKLVL